MENTTVRTPRSNPLKFQETHSFWPWPEEESSPECPHPQVNLEGWAYGEGDVEGRLWPSNFRDLRLAPRPLRLPREFSHRRWPETMAPEKAGLERRAELLDRVGATCPLDILQGPSCLSPGLGNWILCSLSGDRGPLLQPARQERKQPPPGTQCCPQVMLSSLDSRVCI